MISFKPLLDTIHKQGITKTDLKTRKILVGTTYTSVMSATRHPIEEGVSISAINRLCRELHCTVAEVIEYVPDDQSQAVNK